MGVENREAKQRDLKQNLRWVEIIQAHCPSISYRNLLYSKQSQITGHHSDH